MSNTYIGKHEAYKNYIDNEDQQTKQIVNHGKYAKNNPHFPEDYKIVIIAGAISIACLAALLPLTIKEISKNTGTSIQTVYDSASYDTILGLLNQYRNTLTDKLEIIICDSLIDYFELTHSLDISSPEAINHINMYINNRIFEDAKINNSKYNTVPKIKLTNADDVLYNKIITDTDLMEKINNSAETWNIPVELLVGFACMNSEFNNRDPLNFGDWDKIDSSQTVYNFKEGTHENLLIHIQNCHNNYNKSCNYAGMAFKQALKEANGNFYIYDKDKDFNNPEADFSTGPKEFDALDYYINKDIRTIFRDKNITKNEKVKLYTEHYTKKYKILNAMLYYKANYATTLAIEYDKSNKYDDSTKIETTDYVLIHDDYFNNIINFIINYVNENCNNKTL